ncbi:hypothetical protein LA374_16390 [Aeromonas schubertii]|uniref:TonB C-terminal domain-containing protein n=1 Tax=Aeromonas schubertii TaxID=652 RepID=A0ABS7VEJ3_9GAMM|nr:hypothetical protein [Aeromonas schubertii]MBZ6067772.1 hypothetical protein [Aeromonas schubertii]MBZ6071916.1 hypothetical protein [Aeromonas schubertii]
MHRSLLYPLAALLLAACSSPDQRYVSAPPTLNGEPVVIEESELSRYWLGQTPDVFTIPTKMFPKEKIMTSGRVIIRPLLDGAGQRPAGNYVVIRHLIDSKGVAYNPEFIDSSDKRLEWVALSMLSKRHYQAAKENPRATPVIVDTCFEIVYDE